MTVRMLSRWHNRLYLAIGDPPEKCPDTGKTIVYCFRKRWHPLNWCYRVRTQLSELRKHPLQAGKPIAIRLLFWLILTKLLVNFLAS